MTARCSKCGADKPLESFHKGGRADGTTSWCKTCSSARPRKTSSDSRRYRYGLDQETFEAMVWLQDNRCQICEQSFGDKFVVDHDHSCCPSHYGTCGKCVRGLLCHGCNLKVGAVEGLLPYWSTVEKYLDLAR